jgi:hypothetical protein
VPERPARHPPPAPSRPRYARTCRASPARSPHWGDDVAMTVLVPRESPSGQRCQRPHGDNDSARPLCVLPINSSSPIPPSRVFLVSVAFSIFACPMPREPLACARTALQSSRSRVAREPSCATNLTRWRISLAIFAKPAPASFPGPPNRFS